MNNKYGLFLVGISILNIILFFGCYRLSYPSINIRMSYFLGFGAGILLMLGLEILKPKEEE